MKSSIVSVAAQTAWINQALARALIADQFPQWAGLAVQPMPHASWDNRSFLIGSDMVARLPSAAAYEAQVEREQQWLPFLGQRLPLQIPQPLALGGPGNGYPWRWSVYRWIPGDTAAQRPVADRVRFSEDLAGFLNALHAIPGEGGPVPGQDNFHRGGDLVVYDRQCRQAIAALAGEMDSTRALALWEVALASRWNEKPVWVHGDIALGNLLVRDDRLAAVIDFGQICVGDPACDLAIAWTCFRGEEREAFRAALALAQSAWDRGRAWALWKAAIVAAGLVETNAVEGQVSWQTLREILREANP